MRFMFETVNIVVFKQLVDNWLLQEFMWSKTSQKYKLVIPSFKNSLNLKSQVT